MDYKILAGSVAKRWMIQYKIGSNSWPETALDCGKKPKDVYDRIMATDNPAPEDIEGIVGNESWTNEHCYQCNKDFAAFPKMKILIIGDPAGEHAHDPENPYFQICEHCLTKATKELKK